MDFKGQVALLSCRMATVDIVGAATGEMVQQHDVEGTIGFSAPVQKNIAAVAVSKPQHGVHVIDLLSGKVLSKFVLPNGHAPTVTISKDALTVAVGSSSGT